MERTDLAQVITGDSEAVLACRLAVEAGAPYFVSDMPGPAAPLFHTFRRRLRGTHRTGQRTLGLEEAVELLARCDEPVLACHVDRGSWRYQVWMTADGQSLIACTGVERPTAARRP
ncbi:hypothetical protein [Streptomyces avermitilis]|uniref:hypothetical protein n=1 Tax=Streptomyces avermitilis TaxID=33903 RepID=UPI0033BD86C0